MNKNSNLFITILYRDNLTVSHMNYLFSASHSEVFECLLMSSENILVLFTRPLSHQKQYATVSLLLFASFYLIFIYFYFLYEKKTPTKQQFVMIQRLQQQTMQHARTENPHTHAHACSHAYFTWNVLPLKY